MLTEQQKQLAQECISLEEQIFEAFSNEPTRPIINNEDWTDYHQEKLEFQWFEREIDELYKEAQKKFFKSKGQDNHKIKTAREYYNWKKEANKAIDEWNKHHIN